MCRKHLDTLHITRSSPLPQVLLKRQLSIFSSKRELSAEQLNVCWMWAVTYKTSSNILQLIIQWSLAFIDLYLPPRGEPISWKKETQKTRILFHTIPFLFFLSFFFFFLPQISYRLYHPSPAMRASIKGAILNRQPLEGTTGLWFHTDRLLRFWLDVNLILRSRKVHLLSGLWVTDSSLKERT